MPNQHGSIWSRTPGLHEACGEFVASGLQGRALSAAVLARFGITLSTDSIRDHLRGRSVPSRDVPVTLLEPAGGYAKPAVPPPPRAHAKGWEPRVEITGNDAVAVSVVSDNDNPDDEWLLQGWKLDPKAWRIIRGSFGVNRWQTPLPISNEAACQCEPKLDEPHYESRWNYQYKARLDRVDPIREAELDSLIEEVRGHAPAVIIPAPGDASLVVAIADTQSGKADGDGTAGMTRRFLAGIDAVDQRISDLRSGRESLGSLYVTGLGDLIENCADHYAQQTFRAEYNRRDQVKIMRRLIVSALERWAPQFERVVVAAVGGNHGENRREGKSHTDFADNDDVAIFETVAEIMAANPAAYGHVSFVIPNDELSLTLDISGVITGLTHGHQAGKGDGAAKKLLNWWKDQAHGQQPVGDATLLLSGHYHHLLVQRQGRKTHIQVPSLDGGSDWWRNMTGEDSIPGLLTLCVGKRYRGGWDHLRVL